MPFAPIDKTLLFTKNDPEDPRLGEFVVSADSARDIDLIPASVILWGYPDDEGIQLNGGRVGAKQAPHHIRNWLYRMTPPDQQTFKLLDLGDIDCKQLLLSERHELGRQTAEIASKKHKKFIALGGGHDYGYCESTGFLSASLSKSSHKPIIINLDAHLDVRPTTQGLSSGTPFRRTLEEFHGQFDFYEVALQRQCNSSFHAEWASQQGAELIWFEESSQKTIDTLIHKLAHKPYTEVFLSIDIDAFSIDFAPGCSQSWPVGLKPEDVIRLIHYLFKNFSLNGLGIYETSPPLDLANKTSKLAALLAYEFILGAEHAK